MIRKLELLVVAVDPRRRGVLDRRCRSSSTCSTSAILVVGGSYVLIRLGLADLEAGYAVSQLHGHVGDRLRVTYTLRNTSRMPEALARDPQPDDAARRAARAGRSRSAVASRAVVARPGAAVAPRPLPDRAAPHPDRRPVRLLRGVGDGRPGRHASSSIRGSSRCPRWRLPAASIEGSHALAGADAPDDAARDDGPAVRAGRRYQPDPLEDRPPATARSRSRSSTSSRPPTPGSSSTSSAASRPAAATSRRSRRPSARPRRSPTRRSSENRAVGMTVNGHRHGASCRPTAAAASTSRSCSSSPRSRPTAATPLVETLIATRRPAAARDDRGRHHAVARPGLGPAARRAADARRRVRGRHPRRRGRRAARPRRPGAARRDRRRADDRGRGASAPSGRGRSATPSPSTSCGLPAVAGPVARARPSADDGSRPRPDRDRPAGGLADPRARRAPRACPSRGRSTTRRSSSASATGRTSSPGRRSAAS